MLAVPGSRQPGTEVPQTHWAPAACSGKYLSPQTGCPGQRWPGGLGGGAGSLKPNEKMPEKPHQARAHQRGWWCRGHLAVPATLTKDSDLWSASVVLARVTDAQSSRSYARTAPWGHPCRREHGVGLGRKAGGLCGGSSEEPRASAGKGSFGVQS